MASNQLGLLLWKNYVVRKRRPAILGFVFLWPIVIFMLLYTVRDNVDSEYNPTCQFPGRLMPHDGLLPFVQSYICSIGNPCDQLDHYEEIPSYKNATLSPLILEIQPAMSNKTILNAVDTLPQSVQFIKSMAEIFTKPEIKHIFDRGIKLTDLFNNHEILKQSLRAEMPGVRDGLVDDLLDASIKLHYLIETFGSSNIDNIICSPDSLKQFLIMPTEEDLVTVSEELCNLDENKIPNILQRLTEHLDFNGLLEVLSRVMAKFKEYDFISDITRAVKSILHLSVLKNNIPSYMKLSEWLPEIIALFRDVKFNTIDVSFLNKSIERMDLVFTGDSDWSIVHDGLYKFSSLLTLVQDFMEKYNTEILSKNAFHFTRGFDGNTEMLSNVPWYMSLETSHLLDATYSVLQDAIKIMNRLMDRHKNELKLEREILDGLRDIFPNKIMNTLTYLVSMMENVVSITHHVAIIHQEIPGRMFNISKKHKQTVDRILISLDPEVVKTMIDTFSRLDFLEKMIEKMETNSPDDVICSDDIFNEIFHEFSESASFKSIICSNETKLFIVDVYEIFEFENFRKIMDNTLSTFVNMALSRPVSIQKSNLTSSINSVKNLIYYLENSQSNKLDWKDFDVPKKWHAIFHNNTYAQSRLDILAYHLSIATRVGSRSLSYITIKPDLENMDAIADVILQDLREYPSDWINQVREHKYELLESFYLTLGDKNKTLEILEYSNFTGTYCIDGKSPNLVNYPTYSNVTLLKILVCRLARAVQTELAINVTSLEFHEKILKERKPFNWTEFNGKLLEIYAHIDLLVQFNDNNDYNERLDALKTDVRTLWSTNLSINEACEISVGLLCKLLEVMESPLFSVQLKSQWKHIYALAWSISSIADSIEDVLDGILMDNGTIRAPGLSNNMPQTEILLDIFLRNVSPIMRDILDLLTQKSPVVFIREIVNIQKREDHYPCIQNQSLGETLELRPGSRYFIREIERISCNPGRFMNEWQHHPLFIQLKNYFNTNDTSSVQMFNWTTGYLHFRRMLNKITKLHDISTETMTEDDHDSILYSKNLVSQFTHMLNNAVPTINEKSETLFDYIDLEIDKHIEVFMSNLTAREVWITKNQPRGLREIFAIVKFVAKILHDIIKVLTNIFTDDKEHINILRLLGFLGNSPVTIVHDRLPYILATIISGMSDPALGDRISNSMRNNITSKCSDIFAIFWHYNVGLTIVEYQTLQSFACDSVPENFNAYVDLYLQETIMWRTPIRNYRLHFFTLMKKIYDIAQTIIKTAKSGLEVEPPVNEKYFKDVVKTLKNILEMAEFIPAMPIESQLFRAQWSTYRLIVEAISQSLNNAAFALTNAQPKDNILHIWDFVQPGDLRQLLKFLESSPIETISFFATLSNLNSSPSISSRELRHVICNVHFGSEFWNQPSARNFLNRICSWNHYEILKSATSKEFIDLIEGRNLSSIKFQPLSLSITKFLDAWIKLAQNSSTQISVESNIINITTWKNLPDNTRTLVHDAEKSWIHNLILQIGPFGREYCLKSYFLNNTNNVYNIFEDHPLNIVRQIIQIVEAWLDITSGGDVWLKLRTNLQHSKMKIILNLIEDTPNLIITLLNTFLNSERLIDFSERYLTGSVTGCDIDKFLILPSYVRKRGILLSIMNFCQKIILSNETIDVQDFGPLIPTHAPLSENIFYNISIKADDQRVRVNASLNETHLLEQLEKFQSTLMRVLSNGYIPPKIPDWWNSFRDDTLYNFVMQFKNKDLTSMTHNIAIKSTKVMRNILNSSQNLNKTCTWCDTRIIEIINSQLAHHEVYSDIICRYNRMNVSQLQEIIDTKLYWKKTIQMLKNFDFFIRINNIDSFIRASETAIHYIIDIIMNYRNANGGENVENCMKKVIFDLQHFSPGIYSKILIGIINGFEKNMRALGNHNSSTYLHTYTMMAEKFVTIWQPLNNIVKKSTIDQVSKLLPNASLNVNLIWSDSIDSQCLSRQDCLNESHLNDVLQSGRAHKLLRYDPVAANYPSNIDISKLLATSLDMELISGHIDSWRNNATWNLNWLENILEHLTVVLEESGSLLDVASKIDLENVSNVLGIPDLADGVVNLLRDKTVDKLFAGIRELIEDLSPFFTDDTVKHDLYSIVNSIESMEIFKNLGLLDMKYMVSEMFMNWNTLKKYLSDDMGLSNVAVNIVSQAKVDVLSVFMKERSSIDMKVSVCSQESLSEMLSFEESKITAEELGDILCSMNSTAMYNIAIILIQNVNFHYVFENLMSANVKNILKRANLTEFEGKYIFDNIGVIAEVVPLFKDKLVSQFSIDTSNEMTNDMGISSDNFLQDSSRMLCGKEIVSGVSKFHRILSSIEDKSQSFDDTELNSLPTDFCRDVYKNIVDMSGGKIIWSYIKPLVRGQILYTPKSSVINNIMRLANRTFSEIETVGRLMTSIEKTLIALMNLSEMKGNLKDLKEIMASKVMKLAIKTMSDGRFSGDSLNFDLAEISEKINKSRKLIKMIGMLNNVIDCVLVDRMIGFNTEEELEMESRRLTRTNEFLAGIVFLNTDKQDIKPFDHGLPDNITYKIRMDVDHVPSTKRLKNQFWVPGPEDSFIEDLRYLRGFVQLQDSIDRAIIEVKTGKEQNWKTVTQQMPYPCWKHTPFQSTLYESQGLIICFFFALMMSVGSAVRYIVWERESQNAMVMSVMGLKPWRNTFAWCITTSIELIIVVSSIAVILLVGKILPQSDPTLIMFLFLNYAFSIVSFCYMISTMFSSASLAAVTAVVIFLMTFMPYIIVIAMEANLGFIYNILLCLSMSTSFCYGCLFAARKEVQAIGLTWNTLWDEMNPSDSMSLGFILIMLLLDGLLYMIIGFLVTKYNNSARDFTGLRSRSLWWADTHSINTRPHYLAFINRLYFTNDVLHPSTTYQDEGSDISHVTVDEKHIGVRFEGVTKVYHTKQGDVIAVNDFTLKLCEGEVTSLLGRNGAGKTTIIKMLTGMVAPTCGAIHLNGDGAARPDIGVCPQDNVLIDTMTAREHMIFYAKLKQSSDNDELESNVDRMLVSLELGRQEHEPVLRLSGGTRRRLCVALAFLGSPRLVILDEPGAGVDPAARRRIWRLIDQHRLNRTILLSTHHLDEADMLSDTVVIMHHGKIICTGSPLAIKTTHGHGYWMNVSFPHDKLYGIGDNNIIEDLQKLMEDVVPNATVSDLMTDEVRVTLPFQSKHGTTNDITSAIKTLEDNKKRLGYSCISLECDTLERVFLDLCSRSETGITLSARGSTASVSSMGAIDIDMVEDTEMIISQTKPNPSAMRQAKALVKKKIWYFTRNWRAPLAALILPTMFVAVAMGFSLIRPPSSDEPALDVNPKLYNNHPTHFYNIDNGSDLFLQHLSLQLHDRFGDDYAGAWQTHPNDTGTCECTEGQQVCRDVPKSVEGLIQTLPGQPTLDWIISTFHEYIEKRYGGWSLSHWKDYPLFVVWYNNKGHHSLPAYLNALNEAILRASGISGQLQTLNHPLKSSSDQLNRTTLLQHVADVGVAIVLLVAFSLVAAEGARELVRERLSEEKRILFLAGVHPVTYWTIAFIWDFFVFVCSISLAVVVFEIFGLSAYVARDNLPGVCLLLVLFAWASIPFTHLIEKTFDDSSLANMVLFCLNAFIGVTCLATILVIDILGKSQAAKDVRQTLHNIMLLFPQYALGDALVQMSTNDITTELLGRFNMNTYKSPLGWELIGPHYVYLFIVGIVLYTINLALECRIYPRLECQKIRVFCDEITEDEDVTKERIRVENSASDDVIKMLGLRKEFRSVDGTNVAVQNLSIGIQSGTCFGLLGVNGAGKSTTFKMLTTQLIPTAGKIILRNKKLGVSPLSNGEVGYCPQSDAINGYLTPYQCLTIHGEVCGLDNVPKSVEALLNQFDLMKYAHRQVSCLSGGNKRKLCAAISVMSPVSVVLMDEPTSGMDPASKEIVARAIHQVVRARGAVILTSHSVTECERLCSRVGILGKANLRCIGTVQHLKHKFGEGYVASFRFGQPVSVKKLKDTVSKYLPRVQVLSRQVAVVRILIPHTPDMTLSETFLRVKCLAEDLEAIDYVLTQSTLDQVLVNLSEELEDDLVDHRYTVARANSHPTIADTIHMDTF